MLSSSQWRILAYSSQTTFLIFVLILVCNQTVQNIFRTKDLNKLLTVNAESQNPADFGQSELTDFTENLVLYDRHILC